MLNNDEINLNNFLIKKDDFIDNKHNFNDIYPGYELETIISSTQPNLILIENVFHPNYYEILTKGDGSCFYYAIEQINCEFHIKRKKNYFFKNACIKDETTIFTLNPYLIPSKNNEEIIKQVIKHKNEKEQNIILRSYREFLNHKLGFGIYLIEAIKELEELNIKCEIHVYPMTNKQIMKAINEFGLTKEEIIQNDYGSEAQTYKINFNKQKTNNNEIHIMLHHGHFSRLIEKDKLMSIQKWCTLNNINLITFSNKE